ncbi:MAG TPA: ABC transporter ATP-binding protein [Ktedonobacterales bacterium]|nr:ABC transporter ATP-binding protein [Ktedonobacterales bacterium]
MNANRGSARPGARPGGMGHGPMGGGPMAGLGMTGQKAKNFRGTLLRLVGYFGPEKWLLILVLAASIISTVFTVVGPKILGLATTRLFDGVVKKFYMHVPGASIDFGYIGDVMLILLGLYVLSSIFSYIQQYTMAGVSQRVVYRLRRQVEEKLGRLPLRFYDTQTHGEIMSRAVNDMDNISNTLQQSLTQFITSLVTVVGVIILMLTINWILTLVTLVTLPLSIGVTIIVAKRSQRYFSNQQRALGELNGHVEEMFTGHRIVKAFGRERQSVEAFNVMNQELYQAGWRAQFITGMIFPLMMSIGNLGFVGVAVVGSVLVTQGTVQIGDVVAFIQYARQFSQPITQLASFSNTIQLAIASAERIFELLDETEQTSETVEATIAAPQGHVEFQHVSFSYKQDEPLIVDMNIEAAPGETVAIVGPTGAGKTTLVNLLMRFYELDSGRILVDGIDITKLRRDELRKMFGMVLQDTWLFNGTIRENIAYGREDATEEEIVNAARTAQADHFIRTLPDGYDTILNQEASNLSQGQKQLLTIARAVLANPPILILDEATSSVDTRTEVLIQQAMLTLMKGRTSFVIAHRLSTIRGADLILVMNHGTIVEQGTHEELLEKGGFYAHLYNSQFSAQAVVEQAIS